LYAYVENKKISYKLIIHDRAPIIKLCLYGGGVRNIRIAYAALHRILHFMCTAALDVNTVLGTWPPCPQIIIIIIIIIIFAHTTPGDEF